MTTSATRAGTFTPPGTGLSLVRMGYGAMQLAGPGVFGPPKDKQAAIAVLREAVASGVNHIDTSDFYGHYVTNGLIRKALYPYPADLTITTKIGAFRGESGSWDIDRSAEGLTRAVHDNLEHLGLERLEIVNLRLGNGEHFSTGSIAEQFETMLDLQRQGLIHHIGLSNVTADQVAEARTLGLIVCVQNHYNLVHRTDDRLIDDLAGDGIAYVPYFPLGGFSPLQSHVLNQVARTLSATPFQVALAWLLQRAPNLLLIPGTSSIAHLRQNLDAMALELSPEQIATLDAIAG